MERRGFFAAATASLLGVRARAAARPVGPVPESCRRVPDPETFDPWVEVLADAVRNNVREIRRFSGCRLLAVVKNNANGIGLRTIGPVLDGMDEVYGLAVVRVDEALALREEGCRKPIVLMAHASDAEAVELVRQGVRLSPFHGDAPRRLERIAAAAGRPVPIHAYIDTGMNRVGMPVDRALPWIARLAASEAVRIEGTYTMFSGARRDGKSFDEEHLARFRRFVAAARAEGIDLGLLHGAPSYQITSLPGARELDLVRPGGAIYGMPSYRTDPEGRFVMDLRPVFRLRARVVRVERLRPGDGVSFGHRYVATRPVWIATVPVGHTDGYPRGAAGKAHVLIGERLYPVIGVVSSNHTIVELGEKKTAKVGDVATLVGPDRPAIEPQAVAEAGGLDRDYWVMTKLNALLYRKLV